ncbi:hypothetical protein [Paenibacillus periandrae]|uniref:hypothetical protein n=1 Tax=Paenibacillus periandrae TaxID=1761741 RepID=UPI001F09FC5B|nr:hypothetical protein [Paenibacillus periandrae]
MIKNISAWAEDNVAYAQIYTKGDDVMGFKVSFNSIVFSLFLLISSIYTTWLNKEDFYSLQNSIESGKIFLEDGRPIVEGLFQINILIPCLLFAGGLLYLIKSIWLFIRSPYTTQ